MTPPRDIRDASAALDCCYLDAAVAIEGADPNGWHWTTVDWADHAGLLTWCDGCDRYLRVGDDSCEQCSSESDGSAMPFGVRPCSERGAA